MSSLEYLTLNIKYDIKSDKFDVGGDINRNGQSEIVEAFLSGEIGAGKDGSEPNKLDDYHIELKWYPENDRIEVSSDTGNKGLRDGILIHFLESLDKN